MRQLLFATLALGALTACSSLPPAAVRSAGYVPVNHRGDVRLPSDLQRVAVLPAHGGTVVDPDSAQAMDSVLLAALQDQQRFEVVIVSRDDCRRSFGAGSFGSTDALPHGMIEKIAAKYGVDAVLFTDLTVFQSARPLALGFRAKLATIRDVRLVWAFDEVFSASNDAMLHSVRDFHRTGDRVAPVDPLPSVLQSPSRFGAVAADLMFRTLPPR